MAETIRFPRNTHGNPSAHPATTTPNGAEVNPFYQRATDRLFSRGYLGGQHRSPQGDSTADDRDAHLKAFGCPKPLRSEVLLRAQDE